MVGTREVGTRTSKNTTRFLQARTNSQPSELRVPQLASMLWTCVASRLGVLTRVVLLLMTCTDAAAAAAAAAAGCRVETARAGRSQRHAAARPQSGTGKRNALAGSPTGWLVITGGGGGGGE